MLPICVSKHHDEWTSSVKTADMAPRQVVPMFNEDRHGRFGLGREAPAIQELALRHREETLAQGVVEAIADSSHRRPNAGLLAAKPESDLGAL
jgi:hypothetical protein